MGFVHPMLWWHFKLPSRLWSLLTARLKSGSLFLKSCPCPQSWLPCDSTEVCAPPSPPFVTAFNFPIDESWFLNSELPFVNWNGNVFAVSSTSTTLHFGDPIFSFLSSHSFTDIMIRSVRTWLQLSCDLQCPGPKSRSIATWMLDSNHRTCDRNKLVYPLLPRSRDRTVHFEIIRWKTALPGWESFRLSSCAIVVRTSITSIRVTISLVSGRWDSSNIQWISGDGNLKPFTDCPLTFKFSVGPPPDLLPVPISKVYVSMAPEDWNKTASAPPTFFTSKNECCWWGEVGRLL